MKRRVESEYFGKLSRELEYDVFETVSLALIKYMTFLPLTLSSKGHQKLCNALCNFAGCLWILLTVFDSMNEKLPFYALI